MFVKEELKKTSKVVEQEEEISKRKSNIERKDAKYPRGSSKFKKRDGR